MKKKLYRSIRGRSRRAEKGGTHVCQKWETQENVLYQGKLVI